jgi:hypothetical protein
MRSIASRRALIVGTLLAAIGTGSAGLATQAQAAPGQPFLSNGKARAEVYKQVRRLAAPERHMHDANGYIGNYGVVKAQDCERISTNRVQCAWGLFWPNGHQAFSRMEVSAHKQFGHVVLKTRNVLPITQDDEGTGNGGKRGLGNAIDIDPSGTGPLLSTDNGDDLGDNGDDDGLAALGIGADEPIAG